MLRTIGKTLNTREGLIALGISLHSRVEHHTIYHVKGCLEQGCSTEEIFEAIGVSAAVMSQAVTLVQQVMNDFKKVN